MCGRMYGKDSQSEAMARGHHRLPVPLRRRLHSVLLRRSTAMRYYLLFLLFFILFNALIFAVNYAG